MIAKSLEPTVRVSSASSLFVFFALAFALMWICFFTVAFVPIPAGSPLGGALILLGAFAPAFGGARGYVPRRGPLGRDRAPSQNYEVARRREILRLRTWIHDCA